MQTKNDSGRGAALTLQRREFLVLGSAAMVGLAATDLHSDVLTSIAATPMPLLSVGFWNGNIDELRHESERPSYRAVVAADRLVAADSSLVREGARVTVLGFWRGEANRQPLSLALNAPYPLGNSGEKTDYFPWTWSPNARVSNTARFDIPVGDRLDLVIERREKAPAGSLRQRLGLASGPMIRTESAAMSPVTGSRGLKLRRGVYFFAIRENDSERLPSWGSMRVATGAGALEPNGTGVLRSSGRRAPFSYLVVSVDSARA